MSHDEFFAALSERRRALNHELAVGLWVTAGIITVAFLALMWGLQ